MIISLYKPVKEINSYKELKQNGIKASCRLMGVVGGESANKLIPFTNVGRYVYKIDGVDYLYEHNINTMSELSEVKQKTLIPDNGLLYINNENPEDATWFEFNYTELQIKTIIIIMLCVGIWLIKEML